MIKLASASNISCNSNELEGNTYGCIDAEDKTGLPDDAHESLTRTIKYETANMEQFSFESVEVCICLFIYLFNSNYTPT